MALQSCYECGKEISSKALMCPQCGAPQNPVSGLMDISKGFLSKRKEEKEKERRREEERKYREKEKSYRKIYEKKGFRLLTLMHTLMSIFGFLLLITTVFILIILYFDYTK